MEKIKDKYPNLPVIVNKINDIIDVIENWGQFLDALALEGWPPEEEEKKNDIYD